MQDDYYLDIFVEYLPQIIINYAKSGAFDQQDVYAGYVGSAIAIIIGIYVTKKTSNKFLK